MRPTTIRLHDPEATPHRKGPPRNAREQHVAMLAGLAKLVSDVLGEKATDTAAELLRRAGEAKRSA